MFHLRGEEDEDGCILGFLHYYFGSLSTVSIWSYILQMFGGKKKNKKNPSYTIKVHEYNIITVTHGQQYESLWLTLLYSMIYNLILLVILCPWQKKKKIK